MINRGVMVATAALLLAGTLGIEEAPATLSVPPISVAIDRSPVTQAAP